MVQARTPHTLTTRVQFVVADEAARREVPGLSLRRCCAVAGLAVAILPAGKDPLVAGLPGVRPGRAPAPLPAAAPEPPDPPRPGPRRHPHGPPRDRPRGAPTPRRPDPGGAHHVQRQQRLPGPRPLRGPPAPPPTPVGPLREGRPRRARAARPQRAPPGALQRPLVAACSRLLAAFPFPVRTVQPDHPSVGRTELGQQVTAWLRGRGIRHARIRPRTPRLNGESLPCAPRRVERVYRTMGEGL